MCDETLRMSAWEANSYQKLDLFQTIPGSTPQLGLKIASGSVCCRLDSLSQKLGVKQVDKNLRSHFNCK